MLFTVGVASATRSPSKPSPFESITSSSSGTIEAIGKEEAVKAGERLVAIHDGKKPIEVKALTDGLWFPDPKLKTNSTVSANQVVGYFMPTPKK